MKTFYKILINTLVAGVTNNFIWFALVFWAYLETRSVLATSIIGGSYMLFTAVFGMVFGTLVDRHKKKLAMLYSSLATLVLFALATVVYIVAPQDDLLRLDGLWFWAFVLIILAGAIAGNLRTIALSTTVTLLVPEKQRDRANGLVGTVTGISFALTSLFSGLAIGMLGMGWTLVFSLILTLLTAVHLLTIAIPEKKPRAEEDAPKGVDVRGALKAIHVVPGLLALIFFTTFNNFLGGVFMSLMDPYGLNLVSVEVWGIIWGFLGLGFVIGGFIIAKKGLGQNPVRTLLLANIAMWVICILFPVRSLIIPLIIGMFIYMSLIPVVEASEQTVIQKVVPYQKQGRVFGFAQSLEWAASPITSFLTGPLAHFWVIPFMTTGLGARSVGNWFGRGPTRGMALIFIIAGIIGLLITIIAMKSRSYHLLSKHYADGNVQAGPLPPTVTPKQ